VKSIAQATILNCAGSLEGSNHLERSSENLGARFLQASADAVSLCFIQAARFCVVRASPILRTKSLSLREYEMKTCATVIQPF